MAFLALESKTIEGIARDFLARYSDNDTYYCWIDIRFSSSNGRRRLMCTLLESDMRRGEFYRVLEERLNEGRSTRHGFEVTDESVIPQELNHFFGDGALLVIRPLNASSDRHGLAQYRVFQITPKGLIFMPFSVQ